MCRHKRGWDYANLHLALIPPQAPEMAQMLLHQAQVTRGVSQAPCTRVGLIGMTRCWMYAWLPNHRQLQRLQMWWQAHACLSQQAVRLLPTLSLPKGPHRGRPAWVLKGQKQVPMCRGVVMLKLLRSLTHGAMRQVHKCRHAWHQPMAALPKLLVNQWLAVVQHQLHPWAASRRLQLLGQGPW